MAVTEWQAFTQLDPDPAVTTTTTLAARTAVYDDWMGTEVQRRGVSLGWTSLLPWLLDRSGLDPATVPADPYPTGSLGPTSGQGWPRGA